VSHRSTGSEFGADGLGGMIARMFMRGAGLSAEAVRRSPVVGICSSWSELTPCNLGLRKLSEAVKRGVLAAGGLPLEFPTISLSEPYVRPSTFFLRNLMAIDVEEMIVSSPIDAVVLLNGCDKTVPAQLMAAISAGKAAVSLAAGPRNVGSWQGRPMTIDELWAANEARRAGELDEREWRELEGEINPSVGTCNVMGTATTMAVVAEVLGFSLPGTALLPATSSARVAAAERTGARAVALARAGVGAQELVTLESLENAFRVVCAIGGSTNAVIHLEAVAGRAGVRLGLDRLRNWSETTPLLTRVKPSGPHLLSELDEVGGVPAVVRELAPVFHLDAVTATGSAWAHEVPATSSADDNVLKTFDDPYETGGGISLVAGTLAPKGAVFKRSAADPQFWHHRGNAVVFDGVDDLARIDDPGLDIDADSVIVLRNAGPLGGPGMPEAGVPIPARLLRAGVRDMLRITDGRISGTAGGAVVLHVSPESAVGGPLGLVRDRDPIELDVDAGRLDLLVSPEELHTRVQHSFAPPQPARGYERLYFEHITQADEGCDFDFLQSERLRDAVVGVA
jgi:dihydroxy-acid dehydratase